MGRTRQPRRMPVPADDPVADPRIAALLDDVRAVRLRLAADLSAVAAAVDADAPEVAGDILAGDRADLEALRVAAFDRVQDERRRARTPVRRPRRTRALLGLPAVPLIGGVAMTAAAALGGGSAAPAVHQVSQAPARVVVAAPQPTRSSLPAAAHTTLTRLEQVVAEHPSASQVISVATTLHRQLTRIVSTASNDPVQLGVVKRLLAMEQRVLESTTAPGVTLALAESREVTVLLDKATATVPATVSATSATPTHNHAMTHHNTTRHTSSKATHHHETTRHTPGSQAPSPSPTPSNPLFGTGLFNEVL